MIELTAARAFLDALILAVERQQEALGFYAESQNWMSRPVGGTGSGAPYELGPAVDGGERARQALGGPVVEDDR